MIRVAVFGGDGREHLMENETPHAYVKAYEGTAENAERIAQYVKRGTLTHVIVLTRWMNHSQFGKLKDACQNTDTEFITWTRGLGELRKEIELLAAAEASVEKVAPALPPEAQRCFRCKKFLVRPTGEEHELCSTCASANGTTTTMGLAIKKALDRQEEKKMDVTQKQKAIPQQVREAFMLDQNVEWTLKELSDLLYGDTATIHLKHIGITCKTLVEQGKIEITGGKPKSRRDPQRYRILPGARLDLRGKKGAAPPSISSDRISTSAPKPKTAPTEAKMVTAIRNATTPSAYVVMTPTNSPGLYTSREEAIEFVRAHPGSRLFKEVKMKVTIEFDE